MASTFDASRPSEKLGTHSAFHSEAAKVHAKIIRDFAVVGHVKGGQVCILANFKRADAIVHAQRVGGINRGGCDGFGGRHAHLRAGERQNHGHAQRGTCAGIEVGGDADYRTGLDQLARGCVMLQSQMKTAAWQQSGHDVGKAQRADVFTIDFFQVIDARGLQLDGEADCSSMRQLFGMNARDQTAGASGHQNPPRLRNRESTAIAVNITEFSESGSRDRGDPPAHENIYVSIRAAAKFRRNDVRSQKCCMDIQGMLLMKVVENLENF